MSIEQNVTSLKLSKQLQEAGWKKETLFWWVKDRKGNWVVGHGGTKSEWLTIQTEVYPATLASDILVELPGVVQLQGMYTKDTGYLQIRKYKNVTNKARYCVEYTNLSSFTLAPSFDEAKLPDALAKMWLYLRRTE